MRAADIRLRTAGEADLEFLRRVHREAMRPHVEAVFGTWDEDTQRARFDGSTVPANHEIVEFGGEAVGCQWIRRQPDALELVRLYLLPEFQGRGIGSYLVTRLCDHAREMGLPVRLRVLRVNPAHALYRRKGFTVVRQTETHLHMERPVEKARHP